MPIAAAMMPPLEMGVSITRLAVLALQAVGDAEDASEKPDVLAEHDDRRVWPT
jgi:hypothetical protein